MIIELLLQIQPFINKLGSRQRGSRNGDLSVIAFFFKENVRYPVWTCRDPIFSDSREPSIIFSDSSDPIFNSRDPNRVPKTP